MSKVWFSIAKVKIKPWKKIKQDLVALLLCMALVLVLIEAWSFFLPCSLSQCPLLTQWPNDIDISSSDPVSFFFTQCDLVLVLFSPSVLILHDPWPCSWSQCPLLTQWTSVTLSLSSFDPVSPSNDCCNYFLWSLIRRCHESDVWWDKKDRDKSPDGQRLPHSHLPLKGGSLPFLDLKFKNGNGELFSLSADLQQIQ